MNTPKPFQTYSKSSKVSQIKVPLKSQKSPLKVPLKSPSQKSLKSQKPPQKSLSKVKSPLKSPPQLKPFQPTQNPLKLAKLKYKAIPFSMNQIRKVRRRRFRGQGSMQVKNSYSYKVHRQNYNYTKQMSK